MSGFARTDKAGAADDVVVTRDILYGSGIVGASGGDPRRRPLTLDVYAPPAALAGAGVDASALRPAVVMAFGGAFHRGSKEDDSFEGGDVRNTPVAEYCRRFAAAGWVGIAVDYRLVPEDPAPGTTPVVADASRIPRSRVDFVRELMGLAPATDEMLWRGIEAASDDVAAALAFVRDAAPRWRIDTSRIAVGGFSAGARTALNVVFGEDVPAAAVASLSGYMDEDDAARHLVRRAGRSRPPVLLVDAERDLEYVREGTPTLTAALRRGGTAVETWRVPGAGHFYPASATAIDADGRSRSVDAVLMDFLRRAFA